MALTFYKVVAESVQLPNGSLALNGEIHRIESTLVAPLVTAGLLVVTTDFSVVDPPLKAGTVMTGQTYGDIFLPESTETLREMVGPAALRSHVKPERVVQEKVTP